MVFLTVYFVWVTISLVNDDFVRLERGRKLRSKQNDLPIKQVQWQTANTG